jgi:hypothetical protein
LYSSPNIIRKIKLRRPRWAAGQVLRMGEYNNACRILVEKPEGKRPLGTPRCRWVNNIVTCRVVHTTNKTGSISDDWIY